METLISDLKKVMNSENEDKDKYMKMLINGFLRERDSELLTIQGVVESALTTSDLIAFAKLVDDKMYNHRLKIMPRELTNFYKENRISIMKQYL